MFKKTKIMAILNVTPNSFSDGGKYLALEKAVQRAILMEKEGADIIDIGGESTKPGAETVSIDAELERVLPVIQELKNKISIPISIDTMKPEVAKKAVLAGASMINDVSGFDDEKMLKVAVEYGVMICCCHMQGTPRTMQLAPSYPEGVIPHLIQWAIKKRETFIKAGIDENKIILDPGIGFGKSVDDNLEIIHNLSQLSVAKCALLVGASRKAFIGHILDKPSHERLTGTIAAHIMAVIGGAEYVRVHDVKEHREALEVVYRIKNSPYNNLRNITK